MTKPISKDEYRQMLDDDAYKKRSKYNAVKSVYDGIEFASRGEAARYAQLKMMQKCGLISQLHRPGALALRGQDGSVVRRYKPDYCYIRDGKITYEDYKGCKPRDWPVIVKLWQSTYPDIELRVSGPGGE